MESPNESVNDKEELIIENIYNVTKELYAKCIYKIKF